MVKYEKLGKGMLLPDPLVVDVLNWFVSINGICSWLVIVEHKAIRSESTVDRIEFNAYQKANCGS